MSDDSPRDARLTEAAQASDVLKRERTLGRTGVPKKP